MNDKNATVSVEIIEPCVMAGVGRETVHAAKGDRFDDVDPEDAFNLIASGKARITKGELPNSLKNASGKR